MQLPPVGDYSPLLYRLTSTPCEQDYEHFPSQWYCEGCMGVSTFDKIKEYAALSEERREAYEAYLSYWEEGTQPQTRARAGRAAYHRAPCRHLPAKRRRVERPSHLLGTDGVLNGELLAAARRP